MELLFNETKTAQLPAFFKEVGVMMPDYVAVFSRDADGNLIGFRIYSSSGEYNLSPDVFEHKLKKGGHVQISAEEFNAEYLKAMDYYKGFASKLGLKEEVTI